MIYSARGKREEGRREKGGFECEACDGGWGRVFSEGKLSAVSGERGGCAGMEGVGLRYGSVIVWWEVGGGSVVDGMVEWWDRAASSVVMGSVRVGVVGVVRSAEGWTGSSRQTDSGRLLCCPWNGIVFSVFTYALDSRPGCRVHDACTRPLICL